MYFKDQLPPDADYAHYKALLDQFAAFIRDCLQLPQQAFDVAMKASYGDGKMHHSAVLMLTRHLCEQLDGVAVLASEGCAEPAKPLIRSAFEAWLGVLFILEKDNERRGLSYHVAHAHRKIKLYRKLDGANEAGKEQRKRIKGDPIGEEILDLFEATDLGPRVLRLEHMLSQSPYSAIEAEWRRVKKSKGAPNWFSLFGGPSSISALAHLLGKAFWYDFMYSEWSDAVHAGGGMGHIAENRSARDGSVAVRPLRHPDGLQSLLVLAAGIATDVSREILSKYGSDADREMMRRFYIDNLQSRYREISQQSLINVPWH